MTIKLFEQNLPANLTRLREELNGGSYFPLPLLKIQVAKKNGEPRGLCIPTVRDRVAQTAVLHRINPFPFSWLTPITQKFTQASSPP